MGDKVHGQPEPTELLADHSSPPQTPAPAYTSLQPIASRIDLPDFAELPGDFTPPWASVGGDGETQSKLVPKLPTSSSNAGVVTCSPESDDATRLPAC